MHKSATKCNETIGKWCKNKHGASKIIDMFETYQSSLRHGHHWHLHDGPSALLPLHSEHASNGGDAACECSLQCCQHRPRCLGPPISFSGHTSFQSPSSHVFHLNHVLLVPHLIHNLLYIHQFTRDNSCSVEFDARGFSVKDLKTRHVILPCNSEGVIYTFLGSPCHAPPVALLATTDVDLWHHRLGHPGHDAMSHVCRLSLIICNKARGTSICKACQLGKHVRLPFSSSSSVSRAKFDVIHYDLWTSPVISTSGF
jgi:hypothetical protein